MVIAFSLLFSGCAANSAIGSLKTPYSGSIKVSGLGLTGDFNKDGIVDYNDYFLFYSHMYTKTGDFKWDSAYDLNKDGYVNTDDHLGFQSVFLVYNKGTLIQLLTQLDFDSLDAKDRVAVSKKSVDLRKEIILRLNAMYKNEPENQNLDAYKEEKGYIVNVLLSHVHYELNKENRELTLNAIRDIGEVKDLVFAQNVEQLLYGETEEARLNAARNLGSIGDLRAYDALSSVYHFRSYNHPSQELIRESYKSLLNLGFPVYMIDDTVRN